LEGKIHETVGYDSSGAATLKEVIRGTPRRFDSGDHLATKINQA
jgi:hypothetical protein